MTTKTLARLLPATALALALALVVGGLAIADVVPQSGGTIPYSGRLEKDGEPMNGLVALQLRVYPTSTGGAVCDVHDFPEVPVHAGLFAVELAGLSEACLAAGGLWLEVSVGEPGAAELVDLATSEAGRVRVGSVPFAAASPLQPVTFANSSLTVSADADISGDLQLAGVLRWPSQTGTKMQLFGQTYGFQVQPSELRTTLSSEAKFTVGQVDSNGNNWDEGFAVTATGNASTKGNLTVGGNLTVTGSAPLTCRNASTGCNDRGPGDAVYLDRHNVQCNQDEHELLQRFQLTTSGCGTNQFRYLYRCCRM